MPTLNNDPAPDKIKATLEYYEMQQACLIATQRRIYNLKKKLRVIPGIDSWETHMEGACAEMALAKVTGKFYTGALGDYQADDVGRLQVRSTRYHRGGLVLHKPDQDDRPYILATGVAPVFYFRGWVYAKDGKKPSFWQLKPGQAPGRECYFVPQSMLRPILDLEQEGFLNAIEAESVKAYIRAEGGELGPGASRMAYDGAR